MLTTELIQPMCWPLPSMRRVVWAVVYTSDPSRLPRNGSPTLKRIADSTVSLSFQCRSRVVGVPVGVGRHLADNSSAVATIAHNVVDDAAFKVSGAHAHQQQVFHRLAERLGLLPGAWVRSCSAAPDRCRRNVSAGTAPPTSCR